MSLPKPPGPPLTSTVAGAREQLHNELVKPQYQAARPTLFDQLWKAIMDWFNSLTSTGGTGLGGSPTLILIVVGIVVLAALIVGFLLFGVPRLNRRSRAVGQLFGEQDDRAALTLVRAAEAAARAGDYSTAIEEGFRSIARGLAERGVVSTFPGTTAHGFAALAVIPFPASTGTLPRAADLFDGVRYLGATGTESGWLVVRDLERELGRTRPRLDEAFA
jgi:Domain of unknown function (DUF4129)